MLPKQLTMSVRAKFLADFKQQKADDEAQAKAEADFKELQHKADAEPGAKPAPDPTPTATTSTLFSSWAPGSPDHVSLRSQGTEGSLFAAQHVVAGPVDDGRAEILRAWMQTHSTPDAPSATMHKTDLRVTHDKGLAVFSSEPLARGHVALSLAKKLIVCEGHMYGWSTTYSSVGSILDDLRAPMELKLAVFLICARNESCSVTGYVKSLPSLPISSLGGVAVTLGGDPASWGHPEQEWADKVRSAEALLIARANAAEALLRTPEVAVQFPEDIFSTEALHWALGNVYSRSFRLGGAMVMLPLIDSLNHANEGSMRRNCEVSVSWETTSLPSFHRCHYHSSRN